MQQETNFNHWQSRHKSFHTGILQLLQLLHILQTPGSRISLSCFPKMRKSKLGYRRILKTIKTQLNLYRPTALKFKQTFKTVRLPVYFIPKFLVSSPRKVALWRNDGSISLKNNVQKADLNTLLISSL
jgi:hypothetical protein